MGLLKRRGRSVGVSGLTVAALVLSVSGSMGVEQGLHWDQVRLPGPARQTCWSSRSPRRHCGRAPWTRR